MVNKIIYGETHCDTIGDIFKNPYLQEFLYQYASIKEKNIKFFKDQKRGRFTPEFYEFIRSIFENEESISSFLKFIRSTLLEDPDHFDFIKDQYSSAILVNVLLSFEEIRTQLYRYDAQTISSIFSTRIIDILKEQSEVASHMNDEYQFSSIPQALFTLFDKKILPITQYGEIVYYVYSTEEGALVSTYGSEEVFEVNSFGTLLDETTGTILETREEIKYQISRYEEILAYMQRGENIPEGELLEIYEDLKEIFEEEQEDHESFEAFIQNDIRGLWGAFDSAIIGDSTMIDEYGERALGKTKFAVTIDNSQVSGEKKRRNRKPKLRIVK